MGLSAAPWHYTCPKPRKAGASRTSLADGFNSNDCLCGLMPAAAARSRLCNKPPSVLLPLPRVLPVALWVPVLRFPVPRGSAAALWLRRPFPPCVRPFCSLFSVTIKAELAHTALSSPPAFAGGAPSRRAVGMGRDWLSGAGTPRSLVPGARAQVPGRGRTTSPGVQRAGRGRAAPPPSRERGRGWSGAPAAR